MKRVEMKWSKERRKKRRKMNEEEKDEYSKLRY